MRLSLSRRHFLASTAMIAGAGTLSAMPEGRARAASLLRLHVDRRTIEVNRKAATVFGIRQPDGTAGLWLAPGQRFQVELLNRTLEATIVHWHGQTPPVAQDGVPDTGFAAPIPRAPARPTTSRPGSALIGCTPITACRSSNCWRHR